jgi:hypothetical protein
MLRLCSGLSAAVGGRADVAAGAPQSSCSGRGSLIQACMRRHLGCARTRSRGLRCPCAPCIVCSAYTYVMCAGVHTVPLGTAVFRAIGIRRRPMCAPECQPSMFICCASESQGSCRNPPTGVRLDHCPAFLYLHAFSHGRVSNRCPPPQSMLPPEQEAVQSGLWRR